MKMDPNPVLKRLGLKNSDRVVIIHTDDIGMCQSSVEAFSDLWEFGVISSGAVMVPCPWFPYAAEYCRRFPKADMGVHITLNCEYHSYRWGPVSSGDQISSLLDSEGYLPRTSAEVFDQADPESVRIEINAQVEKAEHFGINISHIDTHMGTVAHLKFMTSYIQTAFAKAIPLMILRKDEEGYRALRMDAQSARMAVQKITDLEASGLPLLDDILGLPLDQPDNRIEQAKSALSSMKPGLTHFIIHPAKDTPELRAITDSWPSRVADYEAFRSNELMKFLKESGLIVIGYNHLRNLIQVQS